MSADKIKSPAELARACADLGGRGQKLVFTNGCFDLLHVGHVRYLQAARKLGDALAVALNSDASVRALKGESRPINNEADRAEVLAALECVDFVTIFPDERVTNLAREVRPHIYAKGGDYTIESLNAEERTALQQAGAEIKILPLVPGKSTTGTIEKLQKATENTEFTED
jgi:rfaE bifunctional protein nucleotidyltransferase chain/domain